jgi:hypothetical protein
MNLQLSLITKWFEKTKSRIKPEDYRGITPYFCNKFLLYSGETKSKKWWNDNFFHIEGRQCDILEIIENIQLFCTFKNFKTNTMTLGYPKSGDKERILKYQHAGIEVRTGNPEWGAEEGKLYFVIKHGNPIL